MNVVLTVMLMVGSALTGYYLGMKHATRALRQKIARQYNYYLRMTRQ